MGPSHVSGSEALGKESLCIQRESAYHCTLSRLTEVRLHTEHDLQLVARKLFSLTAMWTIADPDCISRDILPVDTEYVGVLVRAFVAVCGPNGADYAIAFLVCCGISGSRNSWVVASKTQLAANGRIF